jgi:hypothetical protein
MTAGMIEKMHGISITTNQPATPPTVTFRSMPTNLGPNAVVATLQALGLNIPTQLAAAAAKGEALRTAKSTYPLQEIGRRAAVRPISLQGGPRPQRPPWKLKRPRPNIGVMEMGIFEKLNGKKLASASTAVSSQQPLLDGRDRLRYFAAELVKANDAVVELETRLDRLTAIVRDADAAHAALQQAIADDGGVALADYAAGNAPDGAIAKLIAADEATGKAAAAAKDALPNVQAVLVNARSQVARIEQQKEEAVLQYLKGRADESALQYKRIFETLCRAHDQLAGVSIALSATSSGEFGGEIRMTRMPLQIPRFNLPSTADPNEYLPTMEHRASENTVEDTASSWMKARQRLAQDVDAELDDLIGPPLQ